MKGQDKRVNPQSIPSTDDAGSHEIETLAGSVSKISVSCMIAPSRPQFLSSGLFMRHNSSPFKWRYYAPDVILLRVR